MLSATRPTLLPPGPMLGEDLARPVTSRWRARRPFVAALALSVLFHLAFWHWPVSLPTTPEDVPLQATLTELPPPPQPVPTPPPKPKPRIAKPRHVIRPAPTPAPAPIQEPEPAPVATAQPPAPAPPEPQYVISAPPPVATEEAPTLLVAAPDSQKTLPPRVDLAYKVFFGTQGFYIGDATYRFEHSGNRYRIASVGEARGLAALILRGQGKIESRGLITTAGLQPDEFALERGNGRKREIATFDWESGVIALDGDKTDGLDLPTYDPLAFLWQFYFLPPTADEQTFAIATTKRVTHYTFKREGKENIELPTGVVETERWHRRSEDGKTDAFVWLAPSLHYVAVKLRFTQTERGTVEALLTAIRADESAASTPSGDKAPSASADAPAASPPPAKKAPITTENAPATAPSDASASAAAVSNAPARTQ